MKLEIENKISEIKYIISLLKDHANFEDSKKKLENLEIASQAPDIWDDRIKAEKLFKEKNLLEKQIISINSLETEIDDAEELFKIGNDEDDQEIIKEAEKTVFVLLGIFSFPLLSEETEKIFPNYGDLLVLFLLIVVIPIIATKVGKTITRIRLS